MHYRYCVSNGSVWDETADHGTGGCVLSPDDAVIFWATTAIPTSRSAACTVLFLIQHSRQAWCPERILKCTYLRCLKRNGRRVVYGRQRAAHIRAAMGLRPLSSIGVLRGTSSRAIPTPYQSHSRFFPSIILWLCALSDSGLIGAALSSWREVHI
jgi:hypothetical protein